MRILYLSSSRIPSRLANSVHVMRMCHAMAGLGHEVELLAHAGPDRAEDDFRYYGVEPSFRIAKLPRLPLGAGALRAPMALARLGLGPRPQLVYARDHLAAAGISPLGLPFVMESHAPPPRGARALSAWLLRRPRLARLVCISDALRREQQRLHPWLAAERLLVAHDAAEPPGAPATLELPERLRGRGDRLRVGYVGHLYPGRGAEIVVALARRLPEIDFHMIGGTERDIRSWRVRARGSENLLFHGFVRPSEAAAYQQAVDVLVAPYQTRVALEGGRGDTAAWMSPLKVFEYMAARRPMVVSDLPVLREVLTPEHDALLVPPDDVGAWEEALLRLRDAGLRQALARRAFETFSSRHTWTRRARCVLEGLPSQQ